MLERDVTTASRLMGVVGSGAFLDLYKSKWLPVVYKTDTHTHTHTTTTTMRERERDTHTHTHTHTQIDLVY